MCRYKTFFAIFIATLCLLLSHSFNAIPAAAQMDWMKAGKDLLGTVGTHHQTAPPI